jgi:hypothetical protein
MKSTNGCNPDVFAYFRELAETSALRTNQDKSLIAMKYRHLDKISGGSILSSFLQARPLAPGMVSPDLIFPFGCNMSQKSAKAQGDLNVRGEFCTYLAQERWAGSIDTHEELPDRIFDSLQ